MHHFRSDLRLRRRAGRQRGVVMIVTLVALVVLLLGAVALLRSSDASSALAGQLGFRRDMKNQAERAMAMAINSLKTGSLSSASARESSLATANYSAVALTSDASTGLPTILLGSDTSFTAANYVINIVDATDESGDNADTGIKVRYLIDRQCTATGKVDPASCSRTNVQIQFNGQDSGSYKADSSFRSSQLVIYRISVRVDGPRGTQAFFQSAMAL
ncbi:MAG TPA: hypothetical protein VJ693_04170 [Ideonella sp.]|nr:hypothetical protein [Ideonella sp.]